MNCGICNKGYRVGTIVHVKDGSGTLVRKRACTTCAGDAILLYVTPQATRCKCGEPATTCGVCVSIREVTAKKGGADASAIIARLKGLVAGYQAGVDGSQIGQERLLLGARIEGIETAIQLLDSGRW